MLTRLRRAGLPILLCLAGLALASCGEGSSEDAQATLDKAFSTPIGSADVNLNMEVKLDGVAQLKDPIRVKLTGPYKSNGGEKLPAFDWDLSLQAGGQSFTAGAISTGDNAWVTFQGQAYEVGEQLVKQANDQIKSGKDGKNQSLADFGIDPGSWLKDPTEEGDEDVAGVKTTHVSGGVDLGKLLDDLNKAISKAGGQLGGQTPPTLTDAQKKKVEDIVKDPTFDVYVGKDDNKVRRLSARIEFDVPDKDRNSVNGLKGGEVTFEIEFANVGGEKAIEAPANAKPLSELSQALQGLGIGGLGGVGANPPSGGGAGGTTGSGGSAEQKQFQEYTKCLEDANPSDVDALQKCAELLKK